MKLTNEEKIHLICGHDIWTTDSLNGKVPSISMSDGPVGVRRPKNMKTWGENTLPSISYPSLQMVSHTWDPTLSFNMGRALGNDCIEKEVDVLLGPGVNIKRIPINGRNFEYFSEDPLLSGLMGKAYIEGLQKEHIGATLKHYAGNNSEWQRIYANMVIDERTLHEIYLRPFFIALKAKPWCVMTSYNLVNGVRMSANLELNTELRNHGFDGVIMSDWDAVKDSKASLIAELDLEMPRNDEHLKTMLEELEKGNLDLDKLNKTSSNIISLANRISKEKELRKITLSEKEREKIVYDIALEGSVLLKNNGVLPLKRDRILVTGPANNSYYQGAGSSMVVPSKAFVSLHDALKEKGADVTYLDSVIYTFGKEALIGDFISCVNKAPSFDKVIVCVGDNYTIESEERNRYDIKLTKEEEYIIHELRKVSKKLIVVVYAGSSIDMSSFKDIVDGIVYAGYNGQGGNRALADLLLGNENFSGHLSETFPLKEEYCPSMNSYSDVTSIHYDEKLNVGYRYFVSHPDKVLYPFGYGLSYTSFKLDNLEIKVNENDVTIKVTIENTGEYDGKEVIQVYYSDLNKTIERPMKELCGFKKVFVKAHSKEVVTLSIDKENFFYYDIIKKEYQMNKGKYLISLGFDSTDELVQGNIEL